MKLLSMQVEGENRAGLLVANHALDVRRYLEAFEPRGAEDGARLQDALDLYSLGLERLKEIASRAESADAAGRLKESGALRPISEITFNAPVTRPSKILAVGLNYAAHAAEQNIAPPDYPLIFSKCTTALNRHEGAIKLPRISDKIDYEAELALVIARPARSVSAADAMDRVAGYTIMNDVTARDLQKRERQWVRAKGLDSFAPCGPWLVTADEIADPHRLAIELRVNGHLRQRSNTSDLIFKVPQLIEFISQDLTLLPGDIITTGTPSGVGVFSDPPVFLKAGDEIEISIERIGSLRNRVVA